MPLLLKPVLFVLSSIPFLWLIYAFLTNQLGPDPVHEITEVTGLWALRFLILTLAVTPIRHLSGWNGAVRYRRMVGLYAFFYAFLHFLTYAVLDHQGNVGEMLSDAVKRRFITAGFCAFILMIPLALTSTEGWVRRLGGKRWKRLHQLVYVSAICGAIHFYWLVKADVREPLIYASVIALLLGYRMVRLIKNPATT